MGKIKHAHIGADAFGLGFGCYVANEVGFETTIVDREEKKEWHDLIRQNSKCLFDVNGKIITIGPVKFETYEPFKSGKKKSLNAIKAISEAEILTVSVGGANLIGVVPIILASLEYRIKNEETPSELTILAMENMEKNSFILHELLLKVADENISDFIKMKIVFFNTIVDKFCSGPTEKKGNGEVSACFTVEENHQIIIEKSTENTPPCINALSNYPKLIMCDPNVFESHEKKKYWIVEGLYYTMAKYCC